MEIVLNWRGSFKRPQHEGEKRREGRKGRSKGGRGGGQGRIGKKLELEVGRG